MATPSIAVDTNAWNLRSNENGGIDRRGKPYDNVTKVEVANVYFKLRGETDQRFSTRHLAEVAKVGRAFATKILKEFDSGLINDPDIAKKERSKIH